MPIATEATQSAGNTLLTAIRDALLGTLTVKTAGGGTNYNLTTAASTNANSIKSSAGNLYALTISNSSASAIYVKLYNKASAPTVGTDNPTMIIACPASSSVTVQWGPNGQRFSAGIAIAVTGAFTNFDTTAVAATCLIHGTYA